MVNALVNQMLWNYWLTWTGEHLNLGYMGRRLGGSGWRVPKGVDEHRWMALVESMLVQGLWARAFAEGRMADPTTPAEGMLTGFTKVGDDEWNAFLIVRFLEWVSRLAPEVDVRVSDEGEFILAGALICRAGTWSLDMKRIREARRYWRKHGLTASLDQSEGAVADSKRGRFFADVSAAPYLDRREFAGLRLGFREEELAAMTLADVARLVPFPGEEAAVEQVAA